MREPTSYPLAWPAQKPRARVRRWGNFKTARDGAGYGKQRITIAGAMNRLRDELARINAKHVVVSSDLTLNKDGTPRSQQAKPRDPGVAVYFRVDGDPVVLASDQYDDIAQNIAAIAAHIEASRAIERYGVGSLREVFRGFAALPPATSPDDWRSVLGNPTTLADAERIYRAAIKDEHPDVGGSETKAAALNAAIRKAREVLK